MRRRRQETPPLGQRCQDEHRWLPASVRGFGRNGRRRDSIPQRCRYGRSGEFVPYRCLAVIRRPPQAVVRNRLRHRRGRNGRSAGQFGRQELRSVRIRLLSSSHSAYVNDSAYCFPISRGMLSAKRNASSEKPNRILFLEWGIPSSSSPGRARSAVDGSTAIQLPTGQTIDRTSGEGCKDNTNSRPLGPVSVSLRVIGVVTDSVLVGDLIMKRLPSSLPRPPRESDPPAQGHPDHLPRRGGQGAAALVVEPPSGPI